MDFLDIPRTLAGVHTFNWTLPRACFVSIDDFKIVAELDKYKLSLHKVEFGKRNVRRHPSFLWLQMFQSFFLYDLLFP